MPFTSVAIGISHSSYCKPDVLLLHAPQSLSVGNRRGFSAGCGHLNQGLGNGSFHRLSSEGRSRRTVCCCVGKRVIALENGEAGDWVNAMAGELRDGASITDFLRFYDKGDQGAELQTAIVSYTDRKALPWCLFQPEHQVDLVGAVHIADEKYFSTMQKELDAYDCVLYEMVVDKSKSRSSSWTGGKTRWRPPKRKAGRKRRGFSFMGAVQSLLSLHYQLECIDYQKENWYHADLDYETFKVLQRRKGESLFGFATELTKISRAAISAAALARDDLEPWRARLLWASRVFPMPLVGLLVIAGVCTPPGAPPFTSSQEMKALFNLDFAAAVKVFLAKQLTNDLSEGAFALLKDSVIIGERNRVAMKELETAIDDGYRRIAIFYGSGHLPDMDARLRSLGFYPKKIKWQTAWSIGGRSRIQNGGGLSLDALAKFTGWPLDRYQTSALILFSSVLAIDLWFWELFLGTLHDSAIQLVQTVGQFLDRGWNL